MFLIKSLCPGASITVQEYLLVSNFQSEQSIVIPFSLSSLRVSSTQAYLKEPFPISLA